MRPQALAIHNSAVCNCHKDDEFTPLFRLVEQGFMHINKSRTASERLNFGVQLRKALKQFTKRFVPHMKEEEEVFQPLLMQHFSVEELIEMKNNVIKLHLQQRKIVAQVCSSVLMASRELAPLAAMSHKKRHVIESELDSEVKASTRARTPGTLQGKSEQPIPINQLPSELMLKIFSNLGQADLFKAAQVCKKWHALVYSPSNWSRLRFKEWVQRTHVDQCAEEEEDSFEKQCTANMAYKDIEYIDDSDEESGGDAKIVGAKFNKCRL